MQRPHLKIADRPSIPSGTAHPESDIPSDGRARAVEQMRQRRAGVPDFHKSGATANLSRDGLEGVLKDFDGAAELDSAECFGHLSRANARYQEGDPACEADYRAAFLLDARLTASEIVRGLGDELRDDVAHVLTNCTERLAIDSRDVVAQARLGLALLFLYRDAEAFHNLHRAFVQNPYWRPLLRLLVNKVKLRRPNILPRILRCRRGARSRFSPRRKAPAASPSSGLTTLPPSGSDR